MTRTRLFAAVAPLAAAGAILLGAHPGLLAAVIALGLALIAAHSWRANRPQRELDRLFWALTLRPLAGLTAAERTRRRAGRAGARLLHPVLGPTRFPPRVLERKLARVAAVPLDRQLGSDLLTCREHLDLHGKS
jgi:hypothetical protein